MSRHYHTRPPKPVACAVVVDEAGTLCGAPIERPKSEHPYCKFHLARAYKNNGEN